VPLKPYRLCSEAGTSTSDGPTLEYTNPKGTTVVHHADQAEQTGMAHAIPENRKASARGGGQSLGELYAIV
jgi:hypothetical protein